MSNVMKISPCINPLHHSTRAISFYPNSSVMRLDCLPSNFMVNPEKLRLISGKAVASCGPEGASVVSSGDNFPISIQLKPISNEAEFDGVIDEGQQLEQPVVIVWTASWCRKCIYLKPHLEKLAAHYYPSIQFYCVDVNKVPNKLVVRAEVTKMPTIQLWNDGKKQAEVIGGQKAYLVVNEVREMIENEESSL